MATVQLAFRVPSDLLERVDEFAEKVRAGMPGLAVSRTDAVVVLLTKALDAEGIRSKAAKAKSR